MRSCIKSRVGVVIPARNEEQYIRFVLRSLKRQSLRPLAVVVVDDDSEDSTAEIAELEGATVVKLKRKHKFPATGTPYLAYVINRGFDALKNMELDYVMVSGAESIYPLNYVERIIELMRRDRAVVASGTPVGEATTDLLGVRGSGRLIEAGFFKRIGFSYPLNYGFETWLLLKALSMGLRVSIYPVKFYLARRTSMNPRKAYFYGKAMRALGYPRLYALGRSVVISRLLKKKEIFVYTLKGYSSEVDFYERDVRNALRYYQIREMFREVRNLIP